MEGGCVASVEVRFPNYFEGRVTTDVYLYFLENN